MTPMLMGKMCRRCVLLLVIIFSWLGNCPAAEVDGTVAFNINLKAPAATKMVKLWFPYPVSDSYQTIENFNFSGTYSRTSLVNNPSSKTKYLYMEWSGPGAEKNKTISITFDAKAAERKVAILRESNEPIPEEVKPLLKSSYWIPSEDVLLLATTRSITAGKKGILEKARAIYDWIVDNTKRNPDIPGCGTGDVRATLSRLNGKCADISTLYVTLARAAGVPAREVFGLRLGKPGQIDITDGHHCWAEFYLPGTGWVPVDPADVLKAMLQKNLDSTAAKPYRDYYFGAVDEYRIVLHTGGRGLELPEGNAEKINYFMYPYAEVDGKPLDYCHPESFSYTISFKAKQ